MTGHVKTLRSKGLMSFPRLLTETITSEKKFFLKITMLSFQFFLFQNVVKIDEIREELSTSYFVT